MTDRPGATPPGSTSPGPAPAWTVDEAVEWFAESGIPIEAKRLKLMIRALEIKPVGQTPPGPRGGRGNPLYLVDDLVRVQAGFAPWIAARRLAKGTPRNHPGP